MSVTISNGDDPLRTVGATNTLAERIDALQYELREGPCYAAVTHERFVLVNNVAASSDFPRYGPRAADEFGVGSQAAIQLLHDGERAGLNMYAHRTEAFDRSTVQIAELFATRAAANLEYAVQVEQLSEALHTRTDIGTAVGIVMERYTIDRHQAFAFLVRDSQQRKRQGPDLGAADHRRHLREHLPRGQRSLGSVQLHARVDRGDKRRTHATESVRLEEPRA